MLDLQSAAEQHGSSMAPHAWLLGLMLVVLTCKAGKAFQKAQKAAQPRFATHTEDLVAMSQNPQTVRCFPFCPSQTCQT